MSKQNNYQVVLKFGNLDDKNEFENELTVLKDDSLKLFKNSDEANAIDPFTLSVIAVLVFEETIKVITSESVKALFEKLKNVFSKKSSTKSKNQEIPIEIRIDDKIFKFNYNKKTGNYSVKELK